MPFPVGVETVTVSAGQALTLPDGTALQGKILFIAPDMVTITTHDYVFGGVATATLTAGAFSVTLCATDATATSPTGWTYKVVTQFTNAPNWVRYISLPKAVPSVILADILVPDPVTGTYATLADAALFAPLTGAAFTGAVSVTGADVTVSGADVNILGTNKGYRFRRGGGGLDLEATGADLIVSNWSGTAFNGTQRSYDRYSADALNVQHAGQRQYVDALYGTTVHTIDPTGNRLGFHGAAPVTRRTVTGSRGGNAALASLITALATVGLVIDGTTA